MVAWEGGGCNCERGVGKWGRGEVREEID